VLSVHGVERSLLELLVVLVRHLDAQDVQRRAEGIVGLRLVGKQIEGRIRGGHPL
jgi:hypothetical protein